MMEAHQLLERSSGMHTHLNVCIEINGGRISHVNSG